MVRRRNKTKTATAPSANLGLGESRNRMAIISVLLGLFLLVSLGKVFYLQTVRQSFFSEAAANTQNLVRTEYQKRGPIVDRNGDILAQTVEACGLAIRTADVKDKTAILEFVATLTGLPIEHLERKADCGKAFCYLARRISPSAGELVKEILNYKPRKKEEADPTRMAQKEALQGLVVEPEASRYYVGREIAGQILGFAGFPSAERLGDRKPLKYELEGKFGIEYSYDEELRGKAMVAHGTKTAGNRIAYILDFPQFKATGNTLVLTIDSKLQSLMEEAMDQTLLRAQAVWSLGIIQDVKTGEILAMAQAPLFNPNAINKYQGSENGVWRNLALLERFEPGSIVKPLILAAALEEKVVDLEDEFNLEEGLWKLEDAYIHDLIKNVSLPVKLFNKFSTNIGYAKIGVERLGKEKVISYLRSFGFGSRLGIDPKQEATGNIRPDKDLTIVDVANASFGQGFSVVPVQMLNAIAALGNGGVLMKPILVKQIISPDGEVVLENKPQIIRRVVSEATADAVISTMIPVLDPDGTGHNAAIPGYLIAGKTGTAQQTIPVPIPDKPDRMSWEYGPVWRSSFVALVPADDPQIAVMILVADAQMEHTGGVTAAPSFAKVMPKILRHLGIHPSWTTYEVVQSEDAGKPDRGHGLDDQRNGEAYVDPMDALVSGQTMVPDFSGMTVSKALNFAGRTKVELKVVGSGRAVFQRPAPDTIVDEQTEVVVTFSARSSSMEED